MLHQLPDALTEALGIVVRLKLARGLLEFLALGLSGLSGTFRLRFWLIFNCRNLLMLLWAEFALQDRNWKHATFRRYCRRALGSAFLSPYASPASRRARGSVGSSLHSDSRRARAGTEERWHSAAFRPRRAPGRPKGWRIRRRASACRCASPGRCRSPFRRGWRGRPDPLCLRRRPSCRARAQARWSSGP